MKNSGLLKISTAILGIVLMALVLGATTAYARNITVIVRDVHVNFNVRPIIVNNRVLVPLRGTIEELGATVRWESPNIIINKNNISITMRANATTADVNGRKVTLNVPAITRRGTTFVPLRFISENLGVPVVWDGANSIVLIDSGIERVPVVPLRTMSLVSGNKTLTLGMTKNEIIQVLGTPTESVPSLTGDPSMVFYNQGKDMVLVCINGGKVTRIYTKSKNWSLLGSRVGEELSVVRSRLNNVEQPGIPTEIEFIDGNSATFNRSMVDSQVIAIEADVLSAGNRAVQGEQKKLAELGNGKIAAHVINAYRELLGMPHLLWHDRLAYAARLHSKDMNDNNFQGHGSSNGDGQVTRMLNQGIKPDDTAENAGRNRFDAVQEFVAVNYSPAHRENMIISYFTHMGIGHYNGRFTQKFMLIKQPQ